MFTIHPTLCQQKVPSLKSKAISVFKKEIKSKEHPKILSTENKFSNEDDFEELNCYENAKKIKEIKGHGEVVYGWILWEIIPGILYGGIAHAVYKNISGKLYDVTPQESSDKILFIEDKNLIYEGKQIDSIYINLSDDVLIEEYIKLQKQYFIKTNEGGLENVVGFITDDDVDEKWLQEYQALTANIRNVINKITLKYSL